MMGVIMILRDVMAEQEIGREKAQLIRDLKKRLRKGDDIESVPKAEPEQASEESIKKARWGPSKDDHFGQTPLDMVTPVVTGGSWDESDRGPNKKRARWDTGPTAPPCDVRMVYCIQRVYLFLYYRRL